MGDLVWCQVSVLLFFLSVARPLVFEFWSWCVCVRVLCVFDRLVSFPANYPHVEQRV